MKRQEKIPTIDIEKYGGKQVAILDGRVVASGHTALEVMRRAQRNVPGRPLEDFGVFAVPKTLNVI